MTMQALSAGGGVSASAVAAFEFSCGRTLSVNALADYAFIQLRFKELAKRWRKETSHLSVASRMAAHPSYRQIVKMGWAVVPLLLAELRRKPDHWFIALEEITGNNPVSPECEGKLKRMADAWVHWGEQEGHIK
jgi:hypothetical protein